MKNIYFKWLSCVSLVIGFSCQCQAASNEHYFVRPVSNVFADVPFTVADRRPPAQRSFPYIGETGRGHLLVYEESKTNRCIVLLPFYDQIRRKTATISGKEITIESGLGIEFMPGAALLSSNNAYPLLCQSNGMCAVQYVFGNFTQNVVVAKSQVQLVSMKDDAKTPIAKEPACQDAPTNTIQTLDGTVYYNATVRKVEPDGLTIFHSAGVCKLLFSNLPEDTRQKYNYDPAKVRAYRLKIAGAQRKYAEENKGENRQDEGYKYSKNPYEDAEARKAAAEIMSTLGR